MASYSWVSVTALFGYLFLLLAFMVAKKTKVIRSFMYLLECMILAAGGSFLIFSSLFATAVANGVLGAMMNSEKGLVSIYTLPIVCAVGMVIFGLFMFRDIATAK